MTRPTPRHHTAAPLLRNIVLGFTYLAVNALAALTIYHTQPALGQEPASQTPAPTPAPAAAPAEQEWTPKATPESGATQPSASEQAALDEAKGNFPGFIIFESNRGGEWHLYRMNADGTDVRRLTNIKRANTAEPTYVAISPDGKSLVWEHRYTTRSGEIWLMNSDGSNARPLYEPTREEKNRASRPSWLPDGRIKYSKSGSQRKQTIWVHDAKKPDPKVGLLDKIMDKGPELGKNQRNWQEDMIADFEAMQTQFQPKRVLIHETTPDLKNFVAWCRIPERGVWWMSMDGAQQEKIHGGCSPRMMPDGKNFIWVMKAGKFAIGSLTQPVQSQLLFGGPYPEVFDHGYFPYLTPDYQYLVYSACPFDQHDQEKANYQIFTVKMGPDLKPQGSPVRLTFNNATDRYPVLWYPGMKSPATPPTIQGDAHKIYGGPDDPIGDDDNSSEG
jgi:hypothetical protein